MRRLTTLLIDFDSRLDTADSWNTFRASLKSFPSSITNLNQQPTRISIKWTRNFEDRHLSRRDRRVGSTISESELRESRKESIFHFIFIKTHWKKKQQVELFFFQSQVESEMGNSGHLPLQLHSNSNSIFQKPIQLSSNSSVFFKKPIQTPTPTPASVQTIRSNSNSDFYFPIQLRFDSNSNSDADRFSLVASLRIDMISFIGIGGELHLQAKNLTAHRPRLHRFFISIDRDYI